MSKEKQIEEMAKLMAAHAHNSCKRIAEVLYDKGFRKQSEWISVDERLPKENTRVLVKLKLDEAANMPMDTDRIFHGRWVRWESSITHWMPLPEPPKGGEVK